MPDQRISIARVMMIIVLVAANCALLREVSWDFLPYPTIWSGLGILDFLIIWKLILRRPLRAAHYTFLILFVAGFQELDRLTAWALIQPTGLLIPWYQQIARDTSGSISWIGVAPPGDVWLASVWLSAVIALLLAWAAAMSAWWLERRRGWDIAAFWRGALLFGLGLDLLFVLVLGAVQSILAAVGMEPPWIMIHCLDLVGLAVCMIVGGRLGFSRFKSDLPRKDEIETATTPGLLADPRSAQSGDVETPDRA